MNPLQSSESATTSAPVGYYVLRAAIACVGLLLVPLAVIPWIDLDGFREPHELSRSFSGKVLSSTLALLCSLLLIVPHRWTTRGLGYGLKLGGLSFFGGWMIWASAIVALGYFSGTKHWVVIPVFLVAVVVAIGGPFTLVWRARRSRVGAADEWTPN